MLRKCTAILLSFVVIYELISFCKESLISYNIIGWKTYTNVYGRYKFAYPREWKITDCGDGEILLGNDLVDKCYTPVDASQEYLDNLHLQVFLPRKGLTLYDYHNHGQLPPQNLEAWQTVGWVKQDCLLPTMVLGLPCQKPILSLTIPLENKNTSFEEQNELHPNGEFHIGFISRPVYREKYGEIIKSFRFF